MIRGFLLSLLPFKAALFLIRLRALFLAPFSPLIRHMQAVFPEELSWRRAFILKYKRLSASGEMKLFFFTQWEKFFKRLDLIHVEHFERAIAQKRGILFVSVHHCHMRIFPYWASHYYPNLHLHLIKNFEFDPKDAWNVFHHTRQLKLFGGRVIDRDGDMRKVVRLLKGGGTVLIFQDVPNQHAPPTRFLGLDMKLPLGSIRLAELSNSLIIPFFVRPTARGRWGVEFWPSIDSRDPAARAKVLSSLEQMVLNYPEMWDKWPQFWDIFTTNLLEKQLK